MFKTINYFLLGYFITSFQILLSQEVEPTPGNTVDYNTVNMPASPSASSLASIAGNLTVNTATGLPNISIPLYTYELDGVEIPIKLTYNAKGIKVGDMATSVGLNWTLEAGGQISRTVRNKLDEYNGWFSSDFTFLSLDWWASYDTTISKKDWQDLMKAHSPSDKGYAKDKDHNPDLFSYSIPGYSGEYIHTPSSHILKSQRDGLTISPLYDLDTNYPLEASDLKGNLYNFFTGSAASEPDHAERSHNKTKSSTNANASENIFDWEINEETRPITTWKLSKITTKNQKVINFDYISKNMSYELVGTAYHISVGNQCHNNNTVRTLSKTDSEYDYNTQLISRIWSPQSNIEVNFMYEGENVPNVPLWKIKLTKIIVSNLITNAVKEFRFNYSQYSGDPRLKLDSINEVSYLNNIEKFKPPYIFSYKQGSLQEKDALSQDFFGYYNASSGPQTLVPFLANLNLYQHQEYYVDNSRIRGVNPNTVDIGILTDIQYPTGGKTHFLYEPNAIGDKYCGGLRIKEIYDWDNGLQYNRKTYEYAGLNGMNLKEDFGNIIGNDGSTSTYNSNFITLPGSASHKTGYFYSNVTVTHYNGTENFEEIFNYEKDDNAQDKYNYALASQISKKGSQIVKRIEYKNNPQGPNESFNWYALGGMMCYRPSPYLEKSLGYNNFPLLVQFTGNYAFLPTEIATTEYLKSGSALKAVTTRKFIEYDPVTLLKTQEITDNRYSSNGDGTFSITDSNGEIITTEYEYPWSENINLPNLPSALPISKVTYSNKGSGDPIFGQYYEYDSNGNIMTTFQYNKGEGTNNSSLGYVPPGAEQMTSFLFANGKPIQSQDRYGIPTSYVWAFKGEYPVAKIEGVGRAYIYQQKLSAVENATSISELSNALNDLRNDATVANGMVTTYTHEPLKGVKTITDPKGDFITYFYDPFGRLEHVEDMEGNILTENQYHYDGQ